MNFEIKLLIITWKDKKAVIYYRKILIKKLHKNTNENYTLDLWGKVDYLKDKS